MTPVRRSPGKHRATASRMTGTPSGLPRPRPVMMSTSRAPAACRSRSHDSARYTASAPVGNDARRLRTQSGANRTASNADVSPREADSAGRRRGDGPGIWRPIYAPAHTPRFDHPVVDDARFSVAATGPLADLEPRQDP